MSEHTPKASGAEQVQIQGMIDERGIAGLLSNAIFSENLDEMPIEREEFGPSWCQADMLEAAREILAAGYEVRKTSLYATPAPVMPVGLEEGTPAAKWRAEGKSDPHGTIYDCERANLSHGDLTDDEIANAVYLNNNDIGILTAAKERIRWLSRKLASAWLPISTAPKRKGKHFRMFGDGDGWAKCEFIGIWTDAGWRECYANRLAYPTHWQHCAPPLSHQSKEG